MMPFTQLLEVIERLVCPTVLNLTNLAIWPNRFLEAKACALAHGVIGPRCCQLLKRRF